ncbi:MAG: AraC family transcriptional regulator [Acidobacteria bacterium]|nr:AraC family transcriptional regulator [Acidobacteriota bacterium]
MNNKQQNELISLLNKHSHTEDAEPTAINGLSFFRTSEPSSKLPIVYNPSLCVIVQGRKQLMLGQEFYEYSVSDYLAVSVNLPVVGQVVEASKEKPYLCIQFDIVAHQLTELVAKMDKNQSTNTTSYRGLFVGKLDSLLSDCILRLIRLLDTPKDIAILSPLIMQELYYRFLNTEHGQKIAQIAIAGSNMQKIARVIEMLKNNFSKPISVEDMANMVSMSLSSFHHHFKEITSMTPLQYQKRLRLLEARRIMLLEMSDAANTSYRVGYESPSQFSREYSRMFGTSPIKDVNNIRTKI